MCEPFWHARAFSYLCEPLWHAGGPAYLCEPIWHADTFSYLCEPFWQHLLVCVSHWHAQALILVICVSHSGMQELSILYPLWHASACAVSECTTSTSAVIYALYITIIIALARTTHTWACRGVNVQRRVPLWPFWHSTNANPDPCSPVCNYWRPQSCIYWHVRTIVECQNGFVPEWPKRRAPLNINPSARPCITGAR